MTGTFAAGAVTVQGQGREDARDGRQVGAPAMRLMNSVCVV